MGKTDRLTSIQVSSQLPLDHKTHFKTFNEMIDLGANNANAFKYYERMVVKVVDRQQEYIWREEAVADEPGAMNNAFQYPANSITDGVDYSGKKFNFFIYFRNVHPYKTLTIRKAEANNTPNNQNKLEIGDWVTGVLAGDFFMSHGKYTGGDVMDPDNYENVGGI